MKFWKIREAYQDATEMVSSRVRELAVGGIAIVWLITEKPSWRTFSCGAKWCLAMLALALFLDFLQYLWKSGAWYWAKEAAERKFPEQEDIDEREFEPWHSINRVALGFFWGKSGALFVAYCLLLGLFVTGP